MSGMMSGMVPMMPQPQMAGMMQGYYNMYPPWMGGKMSQMPGVSVAMTGMAPVPMMPGMMQGMPAAAGGAGRGSPNHLGTMSIALT